MREEQVIRSSERTVFNEIVSGNKDSVFRLCYKILGNREDAEDMTQETFIAVYKSIGQFRSEANVKTWIYRIALNKCLDFRKRNTTRKRFAFVESLFGNGSSLRRLKASVTHSPDKPLEDKERKEILDKALNNIPENQRTALLLSKTEGLSQKEIALAMNITEGAAESLIARAKKNLQKLLYGYYNEILGVSEGN